MQSYIRDEKMNIIGYSNEYGGLIQYNHVKKGLVGQYDTRTKIYVRIVPIPGRPTLIPVGTGDYGESDIRYWG